MALYPVEWMPEYFKDMSDAQVRVIAGNFAVALVERTLVGMEFKVDAAHWLVTTDAVLKRRMTLRRAMAKGMGDEG